MSIESLIEVNGTGALRRSELGVAEALSASAVHELTEDFGRRRHRRQEPCARLVEAIDEVAFALAVH